jgi:hypothetical protein
LFGKKIEKPIRNVLESLFNKLKRRTYTIMKIAKIFKILVSHHQNTLTNMKTSGEGVKLYCREFRIQRTKKEQEDKNECRENH